MKRKEYDKNGNQILRSGYRKFDKACCLITTGNVSTSTQTSRYIRPYNELSVTKEKGVCLEQDLACFKGYIPESMLRLIMDKRRKAELILYRFFVGDSVIGHVLTTKNHMLLKVETSAAKNIRIFEKYMDVIGCVLDYIAYDGTTEIPAHVLEELKRQTEENPFSFSSSVKDGDFEYCLRHHYMDSATGKRTPYMDPSIQIYAFPGYTEIVDEITVDPETYTPYPKILSRYYCTNPFVSIREQDGCAVIVDSDGKVIRKVVDNYDSGKLNAAISMVSYMGIALSMCDTEKETIDEVFNTVDVPYGTWRIGNIYITKGEHHD